MFVLYEQLRKENADSRKPRSQDPQCRTGPRIRKTASAPVGRGDMKVTEGGASVPAGLALLQLRIRAGNAKDRKEPTSPAFSFFILYGEVNSDVFLSSLFLRNHFHSFYKKCHCASGAGKGESNFIIVKYLTPHYLP